MIKRYILVGQGGKTYRQVNTSDLLRALPEIVNSEYFRDIQTYTKWNDGISSTYIYIRLFLYKRDLIKKMADLHIRDWAPIDASIDHLTTTRVDDDGTIYI